MLIFLAACSENKIISTEDGSGAPVESAAPDIRVEPEAVDFGEVLPGDSRTAAVTIENVGDATLNLGSLWLSEDTVSVTWSNLSSPIVPPGESVETVLTWAPTNDVALADTLEIASDDPDDAIVEVPLSGSVPAGDILVAPEAWDFGTLDVGVSDTVVVTVTNVGEGPLTISDLTYTANDADLRMLDAGALTVLPAVLDAGASAEVLVEYAPSASGFDEGVLAVTSDDADLPVASSAHTGNGLEADPCEGFTQTVQLMITADDAWRAWVDGTEFTGPGANLWTTHDSFEWEMECGDHALSVYATDVYGQISGVIAVILVEGSVRFVSGPSDWTMADTEPAADWTDVAFDDSAWHIPAVCGDNSAWGSNPQPFYDYGAEWIWWDSNCNNLGEAWLRLNFSVP